MQLNLLLFFLLFIFNCCSESTSTGFRFNNEEYLTTQKAFALESVSIRYPFRIKYKDSLIYILDLHGPEYFFYTVTYPEMKLVNPLARKGIGPAEFLNVVNIRVLNNGNIYLLDANKGELRMYHDHSDTLFNRINLSKELIRCLDFTLINDSMFAIPDYSGKYRINIVDKTGDIIEQLFKIPSNKRSNKKLADITLAQAWRSFIDYNTENGILAMVTQLGQVIEIYNLKTCETVNILYGEFGEPKFIEEGGYAFPNGIMGYSDIYVGDNKIYALFWGTSFKNIRDEDPLNRTEGGNIIQVFSLNGEPIIQYTLDKYITGFNIDERNNKLLGLDVNSKNQIVEYQL